MNKKLQYLDYLKDDISEVEYRNAATKICSNHYKEILQNSRKEVNRTDILDRINLILRSLGCSEVSYSFVRSIEV